MPWISNISHQYTINDATYVIYYLDDEEIMYFLVNYSSESKENDIQ